MIVRCVCGGLFATERDEGIAATPSALCNCGNPRQAPADDVKVEGQKEYDEDTENLNKIVHIPDANLRRELATCNAELEAAHAILDKHYGLTEDGMTSLDTLSVRLQRLLSSHGGSSNASGASGEARQGGGSEPARGLTKLNDEQQRIIKEWSADSPHGDAFGNSEARAINLATFARSILNAQSPPAQNLFVAETEIAREAVYEILSALRKAKTLGTWRISQFPLVCTTCWTVQSGQTTKPEVTTCVSCHRDTLQPVVIHERTLAEPSARKEDSQEEK